MDPLNYGSQPQAQTGLQDPSQGDQKGGIDRETPNPDPSRKALVKKICEDVKNSKAFFTKDFDRMKRCMKFVAGKQWMDEGSDPEKYVANITQSHLKQKVASLYARNPKFVCKRALSMDFQLWDETKSSMQNVVVQMQASQQGGVPIDPLVQQTLEDIVAGFKRRDLITKQAKTLEILFKKEIEASEPNFKLQMKQLVRRTCTTGVGYVKIGFQRHLEKRPEDIQKITDITQQITTLQRLIEDKVEGEITEESSQCERLKLLLLEMQNVPEIVSKEGLVFDFPASTTIIVDQRCRNLRTFIGAQWIAQEFLMSPEDIEELYKKDVSKNFSAYKPASNDPTMSTSPTESAGPLKGDQDSSVCAVWEVYNKNDGLCYVVCDGYPDFLEEPTVPAVQIERFWPIFPLIFNEMENEERIYPQSDVEIIMPMQKEFNRSRQALREQRIANRPAYAVGAGMLDEKDVQSLKDRPNNAVIILNALQPGQKVDDVLQPIKSIPIDPSLYETDNLFSDMLKVSGAQEANVGGTSGVTATESSIAESSRSASISSNVDDLDDFMCEMARAAGQVLLKNMNPEMVKKIVGPGAQWPVMTMQDIQDELTLEIEAGSSGRPNKAAEISAMNQIVPLLQQIPGIDPLWLARQVIRRWDDSMDLTEAIQEGAKSIIAMNSQKQLETSGDPAANPNMQGDKGGANMAPHQDAPAAPPAAPNQHNMMG